MPFISPDNSQSPSDSRKVFIGRTSELDFFEQCILQPEKPTHNIISVSGDTGVGKSALLTQFLEKASTQGFKEYCLAAQVGERQVTPISIMKKLADQLSDAGYPLINFEIALRKYRELSWKLESEHVALLQDNVSAPVDNLSFNDTSFENEEVRKGWIPNEHILREERFSDFKDIERIDDRIGELTTAFVDELNQLANTPVMLSPRQTKRQRRVLLFFDTFEQLAHETVPWLLDHFLEINISTNIVLIIAGQVPLERSSPKYLRNWLPYRDKNIIYSIVLNSFSEEETREYLAAHSIVNQDRANTLWKLSRGLPMYLCHLVANPQSEIDPAKDVVDAILRGISDNEEVKRQLALDVSLFSKPFNQDDLEALAYITENDRPALYRWLTGQSFVSSNPLDGRYCYHELTQEMFSRYLYQSPKMYQTTRRALVEFYQRLLDKTQIKVNKEIHCSSEYLELALAVIKQLLFLPGEIDHISAIKQTLQAYEYTDREQAGEIIKVLRKLSQEEPSNQVNSDALQVASRLLQYIETNPTNRTQEFLAAASYLVEKVANKPSFPSELLAVIYYNRGRVYYRLNKYEQALTECKQALETDASCAQAYILRGQIYSSLNRRVEALTDFNRALEFDSEDAHVLFHRGQTYRFLGRYKDALHDLERSIELDPDFEYPVCAEMGLTLYFLHRYQEAIDAFVRAIGAEPTSGLSWIWVAKTYQALHLRSEIPRLLREIPVSKPNSPVVIACQAEALSATKHYEKALDGFTQAIQLTPKNTRFLYKRGEVYDKIGRYEDALVDFTHAFELKPNDASALVRRGEIYGKLDRYDEALQDFHRAIKLNRKDGWVFLERGTIYRQIGNSREALEDFDHAIELDPDTEHTAQEEKGLVLHSLNRHQEAVGAFIKALTKSSVCKSCWRALAKTYESLYPRSEIARLLREIPIPEAEIASVIAYRGEAMRTAKCYEEALIDLDYAIELDPENASALISRGITYYEIGRYEDALQDFDYTVKLNLDYMHDGYRWIGQSFLSLERYQEAIDTFVKALTVLPTCRNCWGFLVRSYEALYLRSEVPRLVREVSIPEASTDPVIVHRAEAIREAGYYEEALIDFTQVIGIASENVETFLSRGQTYINLRRFEEALADFNLAIKLKPRHAEAIFHRGMAYRYLSRHMDALRDFDQVSILAPEMKHETLMEKGLVFHSESKYPKAIDAFMKALTCSPTCRHCWRLLIKSYEAKYPHEQVPKLLRDVNIPDANTASVIAGRSDAMGASGYYEEALADIERSINLNNTEIKDLGVIYEIRGLLLSYLGQYAKAIESFTYGLNLNPNHYRFLYNIAVAMIRWQGQNASQKSIVAARTALKKIRFTYAHADALYGLGGLEALLGNSNQALNYLQQAVLLEEHTIYWARHDVAWLDLHEYQRFKDLTSDDGQQFAYFALKAQSQDIEDTHPAEQGQIHEIQTNLNVSASAGISTISSSSQVGIGYKPIIANSPILIGRTDIDRLADILAKHAANSFVGSRLFFRSLVSRTDLPQRWMLETADVWTGDAYHDAQILINWSISKSVNPDNPQFTTLGSILKVLLPDLGLDDARIIAALIVVYHLYLEKRQRENIAIRYQVPSTISFSSQQPSSSSAAWLGPVPSDEFELQSWLKPEPDLLDVGLLVHAIEQAAAVCRIEIPQIRRYGTGFLVAPDLVLTNYHVLKLYDDEDLEENARNALLRFGCISLDEGQTFRLVKSKPVLQLSQAGKRDYALLQVEERITKVNSIRHVQYNLHPLNEHIGIHILQHPEGEAMKLAINSNGIVRVYQDRGLVQYVTSAREGASGSPCFNEDWEVVALHHAERSTTFGSIREGILFSSIYEEIKEYL